MSLACGGEPAGDAASAAGPPPPAVEVTTLALEPFRETASLLGELRAAETVIVKSEIAGVVESVHFVEGQTVAAGQVLFRLRDGIERARFLEAEAQRALAEDEFERTRRLARRDAAAQIQLERDRAELEVARARAERRREELARTAIRAPFDGRAGVRLVSPGARIDPTVELVRIDKVHPLELAFTVPEAVLPVVRLGAPFELRVAAFPDRSFPGRISFVAPTVDTASRRVLIKGEVPNPDDELLPGMFAEVSAELGERRAFLVPEEALVTDPDGTFVWRVGRDDGAERVPVEVGTRSAGRVEIRADLRPGDRIVTAGTHKVRAGEKVAPVAAAPAPALPGPSGGAPPPPAQATARGGA